MSVFVRNRYAVRDSFATDTATLTFSEGVSPALVQSINLSYTQNVTRLYEIGAAAGAGKHQNIFYVSGRTQGQAAIGRVIGPSTTMGAFYRKFGNVCEAHKNRIDISFLAGCREGGRPSSYSMTGVIITNINFSVQAMDMVFNESVTIMFADLEFTDGADGGGIRA